MLVLSDPLALTGNLVFVLFLYYRVLLNLYVNYGFQVPPMLLEFGILLFFLDVLPVFVDPLHTSHFLPKHLLTASPFRTLFGGAPILGKMIQV